MTPRELLLGEANEWLGRSRSDRLACAALIAAALPAEAVFHAQQSSEKAMKALENLISAARAVAPPDLTGNWPQVQNCGPQLPAFE